MLLSVYRNTLLQNLDSTILRRLELQPIQFELLHEIEFPGKTIQHLFFVEEGMASMTTTFLDGSQVEVGTFGYESVVGISALMGTKRSLNRVYTQIAGCGFESPLDAAKQEFARGGVFQMLALRYVQAQLVQAMQSAGCNAKHNVEQRLARWLLICMDRAHSPYLKLSHELLADMLGSTRPTLTMAAGSLRGMGLIEYDRGHLHILDPRRLESRACECYGVIKHHLDSYAEFDTGITA